MATQPQRRAIEDEPPAAKPLVVFPRRRTMWHWHIIHALPHFKVGVGMAIISLAAAAAGAAIEQSTLALSTLIEIGLPILSFCWWLSRKLQRIEDRLSEHSSKLDNLACLSGLPCPPTKENPRD